MAFNANMQVPDPDIFYEVEGNEVTTSVYEGLVRYKPDSPEIEGALAESWTVSPDGKTYTFKLRPNVKFHDGTAMDSAVVEGRLQAAHRREQRAGLHARRRHVGRHARSARRSSCT